MTVTPSESSSSREHPQELFSTPLPRIDGIETRLEPQNHWKHGNILKVVLTPKPQKQSECGSNNHPNVCIFFTKVNTHKYPLP
ncbi:hypothetical protein PAXRUDRAFT_20381 [Paxillus rubicundulus Ve08.2h10]|uniref:Uncharacterized protein n=1 Tax=Paxillus rubicundulus Ve08.2h10 TaxID=930991 RepID=A0A0D0D232_9AGAM|nr:hypothetical protein PAXRUDRAFT_20381 [Paxillus rubicundulus Ve08.2h10]